MSTELDEVVTCTTNAGDHFSLSLTGDWATDISEALEEEHGQCEGASCDIREAMQNGFPLSAAHLLIGATECPVIDAVWRAYDRADAIPEGEGFTEGFPASEWDGWKAHHEQWGRKCQACGSYTFAETNHEPEVCANCHASLVEHFAIGVVFHLETNRGATDAWESFVEHLNHYRDDLDAEVLFAGSPLVLERGDYENPDFDVQVRVGHAPTRRTLQPAQED
jgi:hypothetical protein